MSRGPARILLVTHSLSGGGAERFSATLANHLDRRRFAPALVAATARATYPVPDDVPVTTLGYSGVPSLPRTVFRLRRAIAAAAPDLVLSNVLSTNCLTGAALGRRGGRRTGPRWIARAANSPEHGDPWLQRLWGRRVYPRADLVVANSRGLEQAFLRYYPGAAERARAIPNPTDFDALERAARGRSDGLSGEVPGEVSGEVSGEARPGRDRSGGDEPLQVLWMGRLEPQKRPDLALEVMARLRRMDESGREADGPRPRLHLRLCGEGSLRPRLVRRIEELGLGDAVELAGFVEHPSSAMADADLFLSTSDFEGLPNALIEAQGLGLPAVATRCPFGPDEIVDDGVSGLLVPVGGAEALAAAVVTLAGDGERRRRMGEAARVLARERFGLDAVVPRWEAAIEEVLGRSADGRSVPAGAGDAEGEGG